MIHFSRLPYRYIRLAMESCVPTFVYSSVDYNKHVSRLRKGGQTPNLSKFDTSLRSAWVERMQRGLFRYHLGSLETRILPGPAGLVAQLNVERGQQRRKPQEILSIKQDFDPKLFNFNKANPNETMFEILRQEVPEPVHENGFTKNCKMIINVSPLEFGHSLIVPEPNQCYPQVLTPHSIQVGIECVLLSSDPGFRVGFNSLGAFASVNHLHLHAYYLNHELAIESSPAESVLPAMGLYCLTNFPRGFLFYTEGEDLDTVVKAVHALTEFFVSHDIAHNLFLTRGSPPDAEGPHDPRRTGVRIVVWPRLTCFGAKEETAFNVALCELAGHLPFKNREDYETTTEEKVHSIIRKYTLPPETFTDLQTQLLSHLTVKSGMNHCTSYSEEYDHNLEQISSENKKKKKSRALGINLVNCKYECVRKAALAVGLREVGETEDWTVFWTDCSVSMERITDMKKYQRINHFPGMNEICKKDLLARNLNRMRRLFPKEYNVFPKTWCLPTEYIEFQGYCQMWRHKTFICKPDSGCQGKGIFITRQPQSISPKEHIICQAYISKPFIIDEYKFDLRLYVLVTSCDPLRIFLYKEGLVRFATSKYQNPHNNNLGDMCMHLTNYAINKHSDNFDHDVQKGSKRKLSWLRSWLEQHSYDVQSLWNDIEDVITKTVIVAAPVLRQNYRTAFPSHVGPSSCFELLGFDILLDSKLKPWLLEVNHSPSFNTDTVLDAEVKEALLRDALTLLNLGASDRRRIVEEEKRMVHERLLQKRPVSSQRELLLSSQALWLAEAEWHEERHSGSFCKIYPCSNEHKYSKFFRQGASYCQETVTSRAREEFSRRMVQMQQDKDIAAQGRSPGKRWSRSEGRGQQGESLGEQGRRSDTDLLGEQSRRSNSDLRGQEKPTMVWDSYETRLIIEEEELARRRTLAQRDTLVRKMGVVDIIHDLLRPKTHPCVAAKAHHPASQEPSLQLREPNLIKTLLLDSSPRHTVTRRSSRFYDSVLRPHFYDATHSHPQCPVSREGPQINLPKLCRQPALRAAKGPRPAHLSVSVIKLALSERHEHRQPTLPLITGRPAGRLMSRENVSRGHPFEPHHCLSFNSVDEAVFLEHLETTDSRPNR